MPRELPSKQEPFVHASNLAALCVHVCLGLPEAGPGRGWHGLDQQPVRGCAEVGRDGGQE